MTQRHHYSIADSALVAKTVELAHVHPTGAELLEAAGFNPPDDHILLARLPNGDLEDLPTTEKAPEAARDFIAFRSDRLFRFTFNARQLAWGEPSISGRLLEQLLGLVASDSEIVLRRADGNETIVDRTTEIRLDQPGTEHLDTRQRQYVIFINGKRKTSAMSRLTFVELIALAFENPPSGDGVQFTVQFTRGPEGHASGTLLEGLSVDLKNEMEFDVTPTNRS